MGQDTADEAFLKALEALLRRALPLLGPEPEVRYEVLWGIVNVLDRAAASGRANPHSRPPE